MADFIGSGSGAGTQPTTFFQLYTDLQNRVRVTTGIAATEAQAKRYINIALQDMHVGFDYKFPWTERRAVLTTRAPYTTGTVSIVVGGTTLTGSSTVWDTTDSYGIAHARAGGKITIAGVNHIYTVTEVTDATTIVLDSPYVASSDASGAAYIYFEDEYALASDFLRPVDSRLFSIEYDLPYVDRGQFRRLYNPVYVSGAPRAACIVDLAFNANTTPVRKVRLHPYPSTVYRIPYNYITSSLAVTSDGVEQSGLIGDDDEPVIPLRYRHCIIWGALYHWYRDKRDDARSQEAKAEYTDLLQRIAGDQDIGTHVKAHIQPRTSYYSVQTRRPYSQRGGKRMDLNSEFDRFLR